MATVSNTRKRDEPRAFKADRKPSRAEVWWWFFMRISGVILLFLVLIHIYVVHLVGEGVADVDFAFVARRWDNVGWKTFDWLMLFLALLHGSNGLRIIIDDYVRSDGSRALLKTILYTLTGVLMIMGTAVVVTFDAGVGG